MIKDMKANHPEVLKFFKVEEPAREFRVWQNDPLAVLMDTKKKLLQKLHYIHANPLQTKWNMAETPEGYHWSSARFYETGTDDFGFLTHFAERFG